MSSSDFLQIQSDLIASYNSYAEGLDTKNWALVRSCFADDVYIDYGALSAPTGAADVQRKADDWMQYLQGAINGFDITRHTMTNHRVTVNDDEVSCTTYLIADHVIFPDPEMPIIAPENVATVVGEYTNHYEQVDGVWKICKSKLDVHWSIGNIDLFAQAAERAKAQ